MPKILKKIDRIYDDEDDIMNIALFGIISKKQRIKKIIENMLKEVKLKQV